MTFCIIPAAEVAEDATRPFHDREFTQIGTRACPKALFKGWGTVVGRDNGLLLIQFDEFPTETPTVVSELSPAEVDYAASVAHVGSRVIPGSDSTENASLTGIVVSVEPTPGNHRQLTLQVAWDDAPSLPRKAVIGFKHPVIGSAFVEVAPVGAKVKRDVSEDGARETLMRSLVALMAAERAGREGSSMHDLLEMLSGSALGSDSAAPVLVPPPTLTVFRIGDRFAIRPSDNSAVVAQMIHVLQESTCRCTVDAFAQILGGVNHGFVMEVVGLPSGRNCGTRVKMAGIPAARGNPPFEVCTVALSAVPRLTDTENFLSPLSRILSPDGKMGGTVLCTTGVGGSGGFEGTVMVTKILWDNSPTIHGVPTDFLERNLRPSRPLKPGDHVYPSTECSSPRNPSLGVVKAIHLERGEATVEWLTGGAAGEIRTVKHGAGGVVELLPADGRKSPTCPRSILEALEGRLKNSFE